MGKRTANSTETNNSLESSGGDNAQESRYEESTPGTFAAATDPRADESSATGQTAGTETGAEIGTGRGSAEIPEAADISISVNPQPRKRGRPKGSTNKAKASVQVDAAQSVISAGYFFMLFDMAVTMTIGADACMNDMERGIIEPALERTLAKIPVGAADTINTYTDPVIIIVGLGFWGMRVAKQTSAKKDEKRQLRVVPPSETRTATTTPNREEAETRTAASNKDAVTPVAPVLGAILNNSFGGMH